MICVFEITSDDNPDFKRVIHINSKDTFGDLHQVIQDTSGFDQSEVASFFVTDELGRKKTEVGQNDSYQKFPKVLSMYHTKLEFCISEIGQKLMYVFDFFNDRYLYVEFKEKLMKTDLKEPFVAYEKGNAPSQFLLNDYDDPDVELLEQEEAYRSFGDLEDYYEIFGELDA